MKILLALLILVPHLGFSQRSQYKNDLLFTHFTSRNGLSNDETTCILEDQKGFMWIGTTDGLNFYSANRIIVYRNEPKDSLSLPDNIINSLAEDNANHLWIATVHGISKMNLVNRKIVKIYPNNVANPKSLHSSFILLFDKQNRLWSGDFGIDLFDPSSDSFKHYYNTNYTGENEYKTSNAITSLFQDSKNRIWVGTRKGVFLFEPSTGAFTKPVVTLTEEQTTSAHFSLDATVTQIMEDHRHQLWLATWGKGLVKFFPDEQKMISYSVKNPDTQKVSTFNVVNKISETKIDHDRFHFWASTDQGLAALDSDGNFNFYVHAMQDHRSPSIGGVRQLYAGRSGILWSAMETEGIDLLDPYRQVFKTHFLNTPYLPALQFGSVNCIYSSSTDSTWVATWYGNALYLIDNNFRIRKKWQRVPDNSPSEESNRANDLFKDKEGKIWISTLNGLHCLDPRTSHIQSYYHNDEDSSSLPSNRVVRYFEDSEGISWVCFYKRGICQFNKKTGTFFRYQKGETDREGHIYYFNIWDMMEDHAHNLWFADDALGLWKYNRKKKKLEHMFVNQLRNGHIATITEDRTNTIWVATRNGLGKIKGSSLETLTTADGLPTNTFFGARTDKQNRLWILSNQGMILYDEHKKMIKVFKEDDGLEKVPIDGAILYALKDGRMVIGGNNYVTEFDPNTIAINLNKPPVYITDFKVFGTSYPWKEEGRKTVTLSHDMNEFSFDFAVLNYSNPSENRFYYQLVGLDKTWNSSGQGFANYTNLDDGKYLFKVKGSNSDGTMNEEGDSITIIIRPPFWRTWWFAVFCLLSAFALLYSVFRYRLQQALKVERMRTRISSDLHDDIGSTLSSISILSNLVLQEGVPSSAHTMIAEINDNSLQLMEKMDDIVWSINPSNDTLNGLLVRVKQFAAKLFEAKGIDYDFDIPENISGAKLSIGYNQHIYLIMKEAINNMIKYAECTKARVDISFSSPVLSIKITDNGKGFAPRSSFTGNGIKSMHNRAELMNANFHIVSQKNKGTVILLSLKIK